MDGLASIVLDLVFFFFFSDHRFGNRIFASDAVRFYFTRYKQFRLKQVVHAVYLYIGVNNTLPSTPHPELSRQVSLGVDPQKILEVDHSWLAWRSQHLGPCRENRWGPGVLRAAVFHQSSFLFFFVSGTLRFH